MTRAHRTSPPHRGSRTAAWYYARYQPAYPEAMIDFIVDRAHLRPDAWVIDVGCGTGAVGLALASRGARVIGLDPLSDRIDQARADAVRLMLSDRTQWRVGTGNGLRNIAPRAVQVVAFGKSLHRMNRPRVLEYCDRLVAPGGVVAVLTMRFSQVPDWMPIGIAVSQELQGQRGDSLGRSPQVAADDHAVVLRNSPFCVIDRWSDSLTLRRTVDEVVGLHLGMERLGAGVVAAGRRKFKAELRSALLAVRPDGVFIEHYALEVLCGRRNQDAEVRRRS